MNQNLEKKFASLGQSKFRKEHELFLIEGEHCVEELLKSDWNVEKLLISGPDKISYFEKLTRQKNIIELVKAKTLRKIATTKTPQSVIAVARIPRTDNTLTGNPDKIVITDNIKDPGNMGTIIRTAVAFGFDQIITTDENVEVFNPKVVRSTQGAMFHISLAVDMTVESIISELKETHKFYALSSHGDINIENIQPAIKSAIIIGSEVHGLSKQFLDITDYLLRIPISDKVESLNAASAAAIAMYKLSDCVSK